MHKHIKPLKYILICILLMQLSCSEFSTKPSTDGPQFSVQVSFVDEMPSENLMYSGYKRIMKNRPDLNKSAITEAVDQGHVLVLDFSKYENMEAFWGSEEHEAFNETARKIEEDSLSNWSQWVSAFEENFNIVADQSFSVDEDTAFLNISGVIGLNYFILALTDNDLIRYTGEDHGHGVAGESETVYIWMSEWELYEENPDPQQPQDTQFEVITTISLGENPRIPVLSQNEEYIYVVNEIGTDTYVSAISTANNIVDEVVRVGSSYCWAQIPVQSPDGNFLWVPIKNNDRIDIISTATHTLVDSIVITENHLDFRIDELAFSADGETAFAVSSDAEDGVFIDVQTREVTEIIDMNSDYANHVIADMNNDFFYVSDYGGDGIFVISIQDRNIQEFIATGDTPEKPTLTPDGTQLYVPNNGYDYPNSLVQVIDIATLSISGAFSVGRTPKSVSFTSDGKYCYVPVYSDDSTIIFNVNQFVEVDEITVGRDPYEGTVSPDDKYYFSPSWNDGVLSVISIETQTLLEHIPVGTSPQKPVITQDWTIYTTNYNSNSVSVIREKSD